ncbi:MAG: type III pantothenate kinase [Vicingaceae bacterium]
MNFIIDQGNTFTKLALFEDDKLIISEIVKDFSKEKINSFLSGYSVKNGILSSVRKEFDTRLLKKHKLIHLSHLTPIPLQIKYKTPETLGVDRIAAAIGARVKNNKHNLLVIDLGTCVTFDFINSKNEYLGGAISPGFEMRFKALNYFTEKLPAVQFNKEELKLIGNSTENSIMSGVYSGLKHEIEGVIKTYISQYEDLKIVVTGGDINLFDLEPKNRIFADEFLVLKGLNEILNYNEE